MTSTQNKSEDPKDPPPAPPGKTEEWFARALGSLIFLVPLYYIFVWNNLPLDAQQGNRYRWWITIGVLALGAFIGIFSTRKKIKIFEVMSNFIVVFFIVFGAAIFSLYFSQHDQTILYKVFVIAYFSFLPAWLYLHFISVKGRTLWEEYVLNLYRLHMDDVGNLRILPLCLFSMSGAARNGATRRKGHRNWQRRASTKRNLKGCLGPSALTR